MWFYADNVIANADGKILFKLFPYKHGDEIHQFITDEMSIIVFEGPPKEGDKYMIRLANKMNAIDLELLGEELQ